MIATGKVFLVAQMVSSSMFTVSCLRPETRVAMINDEPIVKSALASSDIWQTQEGAYN